MAGIGFELKRLFKKKGVFAGAYAYGYAFIVCCGPMLLGMLLLLGVGFIAKQSGASMHERELLNAMITVSLLVGLAVSSFFSLVCTRYIADMLYEEMPEKIMPSFWGVTGLSLIPGCLFYAIFLHFAGIPMLYRAECFVLCAEVIITWTQMSYLTALKDYKGIRQAFLTALVAGFALGFILVFVLHLPVVASLMFSMIVSYFIMVMWYLSLLLSYFNKSEGNSLDFLRYMDKYPTLALNGLFVNVGLFAHLVMLWLSPQGVQIQGLFYHCPDYDLAAVFAFLSILITTVNYVVSVEVHFYPCYRDFYALYNDKGTIYDIKLAGQKMCEVLSRELKYAAMRQLFCSILFIVFGSVLFQKYPLGFTEESLGIFRVLCIGYGMYAIGNMIMLSLLYFCDNIGAFFASAAFALGTMLGTLISLFMPSYTLGLGFALGGFCFVIVGWLRLEYFIQNLSYHLLSRQPIISYEKHGFFTDVSLAAEKLSKQLGKRKNI